MLLCENTKMLSFFSVLSVTFALGFLPRNFAPPAFRFPTPRLSPLALSILYFFGSASFKASDTTKMGPPLHWTPTKDDIRNAAMNDFRIFVNRQYGTDFEEGDYWSLHAWSIANTETINQFWNAIWDFSGVIGDKGAQPVGPRCIPDDNFHEADPL
jgi:hypothetical protein